VQVKLGYRDREGAVTERIVHPLGLVSKGTTWYLVADTAKGQRTFRVWRVQSVEVTDEPAVAPPDFDLNERWQEIVADIDELRGSAKVQARVAPEALGWLYMHFGNERVSVGGTGDDGWIEVEIGFNDSYNPAVELAGYAAVLDVTAPPEVREALGTIGTGLVARYVEA